MGDVVRVKDGFARNFLLPRGKALRATAENRTRFETMKGELEARSLSSRAKPARLPRSSTARASRRCARPRKPVSFSARCRRAISSACSTTAGLQCQPQPDRAQHADQDDRPAHCSDRAASGDRDDDHASSSPATTTKRRASSAARTSRSCAKSGRRRKRPCVAAEAFFEPEAAKSARARSEDAEREPLPRPTRADRPADLFQSGILSRGTGVAGFAGGGFRRRGGGRRRRGRSGWPS